MRTYKPIRLLALPRDQLLPWRISKASSGVTNEGCIILCTAQPGKSAVSISFLLDIRFGYVYWTKHKYGQPEHLAFFTFRFELPVAVLAAYTMKYLQSRTRRSWRLSLGMDLANTSFHIPWTGKTFGGAFP